MTILDFILLIPIAWGAYKGFTKGLIMSLVNLIAFILGIIIGFKLMEAGVSLLRPYYDNKFVPLLSFLIIFILVVFGVNLLGKIIQKTITISIMSLIDKIGGALFGALFWVIAFSVILWLLDKAHLSLPKEYTDNSLVFPYFIEFGPIIIGGISSIVPITKGLFENIKKTF